MDKPLGKRVRRDPNVRLAEEEERRSRAQQLASSSARAALSSGIVPNPTRHVPDARGFTPLSATELDADLRVAEDNFQMAVEEENEADFPQIDLVIDKSIMPPCGSDSTSAKKKIRFVSWIQDPELLQSDLLKYRKTVAQVGKEYDQLVAEDDSLVNAMQLTRRELLNGLNVVSDERDKMKFIRNAIGDQILSRCNLSAKADYATLVKKKAVGSIPRDIIDEISDIHFDYIEKLEKYVAASAEIAQASRGSGNGDSLPAAGPPGKRAKRSHATQPQVTNVDFPVAVLELSAEEEAQARKVSLSYRARLAGLHRNDIVADGGTPADTSAEPVVTSGEKDEVLSKSGYGSCRMSLRRAPGATDDSVTHSGTSSAAVLSRFCGVEEQLRYLETTSVGEIVSDQFPSDEAQTDPSPPPLGTGRSSLESGCMARLNELFFCGNTDPASSARAVKPTKKKSRGVTASIVLTARPLLNCPRGVPLLVSPAGLFPERVVGLAANTADGQEGASLSRIPQFAEGHGSSGDGDFFREAAEQERNALAAQSLRRNIISSEVVLARLTKDVADWQATAADVDESLNYATQRHLDAQHYNAADVLSIREQMMGRIGTTVTENGNGIQLLDGGNQRNGFFRLCSDDADMFGSKNGGKNKKSKKSSKQRQVARLLQPAKVAGDSTIDILTTVAGTTGDENAVSVAEAPSSPGGDEDEGGGPSKVNREDKATQPKSLRSKRTL